MIESVARSAGVPAELGVVAWLRRNALVCIAGALYACAVFVGSTQEFEQDSWLSLSGGRDIARHGLPWHDRLTALTHGAHWVDQQWLGKLFLYGVTATTSAKKGRAPGDDDGCHSPTKCSSSGLKSRLR